MRLRPARCQLCTQKAMPKQSKFVQSNGSANGGTTSHIVKRSFISEKKMKSHMGNNEITQVSEYCAKLIMLCYLLCVITSL